MAPEDNSDDITRSHMQPIGDRMVEHYRIIGKIGAGGMGEVFLAEDTRLERKVALKFLPVHLCQDTDYRARFMREARAAARLDHPNIVTVYEVSEFKGQPYFAMQYVDGRSLKELTAGGTLTLERILGIAMQVCEGLAAAHENGITHRDIKPSNILIDSRDRARIADFGLASIKGVSRITKTGLAIGTLFYMSPEQVRGEDLDEKTDIFSLGIVLYEMLTGQLPFEGEHEPAVIYGIINSDPTPVSQQRPDVPAAIDTIMAKALHKDRRYRYQTARDFLKDLQSLDTASPIAPAPKAPYAEVKSIAILYLRNMGLPEDDYLSFGLTEDLIIAVTRMKNLQVTPMRTILKWKDSEADLEEIGRRLNVGLVLDGSILRTGERMRLSAQLIDVHNESVLWADRWEEPISAFPKTKWALAQGIYHALGIDSPQQSQSRGTVTSPVDPQAYEYYLRARYAFEHKQDKADTETALGLYQRAFEMDPALVRARIEAARIHLFKGDYEKANRELNEALEEAGSRHLKGDEAYALRLLATSHSNQSQWDEAWEACQKALALDKEFGDLRGEAESLAILINILLPRARSEEALQLFQRVLEINRRLGDQEQMLSALVNIGAMHYYKGDFDKAFGFFMEALAIARKRDDQSLVAKCLNNVGIIHINTGDYGEAMRRLQEALQIYEKLGQNQISIASTINNIAFVHGCRGDYRKALELNEKGSAIHRQQSNLQDHLISQSNIAHDLIIIGDYEKAIKISGDVLAEAEKLRLPVAASSAHNNLGLANFWTMNKDRALHHLHRAIEIAVESGLRGNQSSSHSRLAELYHYYGEFESGRKHGRSCMQLLEQQNRGLIWVRTSILLMVMEAECDNTKATISHLRRFLDEARRMECPELIIFAQRHLGMVLLADEQDQKSREEGIAILQSALGLAAKTEIEHEIRWISGRLKDLT